MTENINPSRTEEPIVAAVAGDELAVPKRKYERNPNRVMCKARSKRTGDPCNNPPVAGATVCRMHGGSAPQVRAAARVRLEMAADRAARELLRMAMDDPEVADSVKLAALRDALDRAGLSAKTAVSVEVGPSKAYEEILTDAMTGGSRAESRAERGVESTPTPDWLAEELDAARAVDDDVVDAEVVEVTDEPSPRDSQPTSAPKSAVPSNGLMSMEDALEQLSRTSPPPVPLARRRGRR